MKEKNFIHEIQFNELYKRLDEIAMMLHGLIRK
jgi:hypothetical protein